jgi:hypothetical protein
MPAAPLTHWEITAAAQRRVGDDLILAETGRRADRFTLRQLRDILSQASHRPASVWRQDKADLVAHVQRYVMTENHGPGLLAQLKEIARG